MGTASRSPEADERRLIPPHPVAATTVETLRGHVVGLSHCTQRPLDFQRLDNKTHATSSTRQVRYIAPLHISVSPPGSIRAVPRVMNDGFALTIPLANQ